MDVNLMFFKGSGKYYTEEVYHNQYENGFEVYVEVRGFNSLRIMPGLSAGHWDGYVLVTPVDGVPALLDFTK